MQLADLFDLTRAMPDQAQIADVLVVLGRLAHNSDVQFNSITPGASFRWRATRRMPMQVVLRAATTT